MEVVSAHSLFVPVMPAPDSPAVLPGQQGVASMLRGASSRHHHHARLCFGLVRPPQLPPPTARVQVPFPLNARIPRRHFLNVFAVARNWPPYHLQGEQMPRARYQWCVYTQ